MPKNTASLLEQLTGYTHAFDAYDRSVAGKHPVNFAHYITMVGGQRLHVLGRISNAPLDHTNRSNKLAHLIAFDDSAIDFSKSQGPAAVIRKRIAPRGKSVDPMESDFWMTEWPSDREPKVLPDSRTYLIPAERDVPVMCDTWKQMLGDAGWAAVLAESVRDRKRKTVPVVFSADQKDQCLDLIVEALSLLPPEERWDVSFSTFYSGSLPTKVECRWQFLLDSTDLARKALRTAHRNPVIDLTSLRGQPAESNELTPFVLSRDRPWLSAASRKTPTGIPGNPGFRSPRRQEEAEAPAEFPEDGTSTFELRKTKRHPAPVDVDEKVEHKPDWLPRIVIVSAVLIFLLCGAVLYPKFTAKPDNEFAQFVPAQAAASPKRRESDRVREEIKARQRARLANPQETDEPDDTVVQPVMPQRREPPPDEAIVAVAIPDKGKAEPEETAPVPEQLPFDFIRTNLNGRLSLSIPRSALDRKPRSLATVYVDSALDCDLAILGGETVLKEGVSFQVEKEDVGEGEAATRRWTVLIRSDASKLSRPVPVAEFTLSQKQLTFNWVQGATFELAGAEARLTATNRRGDDVVVCSLREPVFHEVARLPDAAAREIKLLDSSEFSRVDGFVLDCRIDGLPEYYEGEASGTLVVLREQEDSQATPPQNSHQPKSRLLMQGKKSVNGQPYSLMEVELSLEQNEEGDLVVRLAQFLEIPFWNERSKQWQIIRSPFKPSVFEDLLSQAKKNGDKVKAELAGLEEEVKQQQKRVDKLMAETKSNDRIVKALAMRQLPGADDALNRLKQLRDISREKVRFVANAQVWHGLVSADRDVLKKNVEVRYELKRASETTDGVTVPIVATRD